MSSDKVLKKTVFGGFDKENVLGYIENLQAEIAQMRKELDERNIDEAKNAKLNEQNDELKKELEKIKGENDALSKENESLLKANAEYELRMEEFNSNEREYKNKISYCTTQFEEIEKLFAEVEEEYNNRKMPEFNEFIKNMPTTRSSAEIQVLNEKLESSFSDFEKNVNSLRTVSNDIEDAFKSFENMFNVTMDDMMNN